MKPVRGFTATALLAVLLTAPLARATTVTWVTAGPSTNDWFDTNNWSTLSVPAAADDVIINSNNVGVILTNSTAALASILLTNKCTLIFSNWDTKLSATNINIYSNATLTHPNNSATTTNGAGEWVPDARVWIVCSNLTIAAGAKIDVSDRGYLRGASQDGGGFGPGRGIHRGGCYGGFGTVLEHPSDSLSYGGVTNGDAADPWQPGSGGERWHSTAPGTHGGGAVRIEATGVVTVNGQILANAINGLGAPGSGGGIYIKCLRLDGTNGLIAANGGRSTSIGGYQTDGGGGRIAVIYTNSEQTASPGVRFSAVGGGGIFTYAQSSLGTLYFPDTKLLSETVADSMAGRLVIPGFTNWALNRLVVSNSWLGFSGEGFRLTVTNDITVIGKSALSNQLEFDAGAVVTCGDLLLTNAALTLYGGTGVNAGATVNVGGNLTFVGTNTALYLYNGATNTPGAWSAALNVTGDVTIVSNTWINLFSQRANGGSARLTMRSLDIASGGGINADGRGYGRGAGTASGPGYPNPAIEGRGAGHGGKGGGGTAAGGTTYGNSNAPIAGGSSGQRQSSVLVGTGGGVIWIEASQNVRVDGRLIASGKDTNAGNIGGAGSGGSIYIVCRRFRGAGSLEASGGDSLASSGGGGGGGRIAVYRMYHESTASTDVAAGSGTGVAAEAGTMVWGLFPVPGTIFTIH